MRKPRKFRWQPHARKFWPTLNIMVLCLNVFLASPAQASPNETQQPEVTPRASGKQHGETLVTAQQLRDNITTYLTEQLEQERIPEGQTIDFTIEQLDLRISLSACEAPLDIKPYHRRTQSFSGRMTLQVTCEHPKPWRLFIPVRFTRMDRVVVSTQPINRRSSLSSDMLDYKRMDVSNLPNGYYRDIERIAGFEAKQFIQQGRIISPHHLTPPRLIKRQQEVTIISQTNLISVKATGVALSDGRMGDRIKVKNKKSQRIIEAKVEKNGVVYASP